MSRLTKHDDYGYPLELRQQPSDVIHRQFSCLLHGWGSTYAPEIVEVGVLISEADLDSIHNGVMLANNEEARRARYKGTSWIRRKVIVWRGCYAIVCRVENRYVQRYGRPIFLYANNPLAVVMPRLRVEPEVVVFTDFASQLPGRRRQ